MPLVEIVPNPETSDETVTAVYDLLKAIGKTPVLVKKEAPGFIGNRLQAALLREAISIVERGIVSPQEVDSVIKNGFGRRLALAGVFEIFDIAGWDLVMAGLPYLKDEIESSREFSPMVKEMVSRGELGVKTGKGFYQWSPESAEALKKRIAQGLINLARWSYSIAED
jgi:3-hydroxybutyryl-CoA dehydrogenase